MERLEIALEVKSTKHLEFKQTLSDLSEKLQKRCASLKITDSDNFLSYSFLAQWETFIQMQEALKTDEFAILSGTLTALCEKTTIRLNNKLVGNHISMLANIKNNHLKYLKL